MASTPHRRRYPPATLLAICLALGIVLPTSSARAASEIGSLDPAFGAGGRLTLTDYHPASDFPPLALPDGRFRVLAQAADGRTVLLGFLANGSPDTGFGSQGVVTFGTETHPRAMALDGNGDIVLTGTTGAAPTDEVIMRRLSGGGLDSSFGTNGRVVLDFLGTDDVGCGIAVDGSGRIVVAGDTVLPSTTYDRSALTVERLLADGAPDAAFATDGSRIFKRNPHLFLCSTGAIDVRPFADGSIALAGRATSCSVVRITKGGALDDAFGSGGTLSVTSIDSDWGFGSNCRMTTDPQGRVLVTSRSDHRVGTRRFNIGVVRLLADGSRDPAFRGTGSAVIDMFGGDDFPEGIVVDGAGGIVISSRTSRLGRQPDAGLLRLLDDGTIDGAFGFGGRIATDLTAADSDDGVAGTALLSGGGLLLLGHVFSDSGPATPVVAAYGPVTLDTSAPVSEIGRPRDGATYGRLGLQVVRGTADDSLSMVRRVRMALRAVRTDGTCRWLRRDGDFVSRACDDPLWLDVHGTYLWHKRLPIELPLSVGTRIAHYNVYSRATDLAGNVETTFERGRNNDAFEIGT